MSITRRSRVHAFTATASHFELLLCGDHVLLERHPDARYMVTSIFREKDGTRITATVGRSDALPIAFVLLDSVSSFAVGEAT